MTDMANIVTDTYLATMETAKCQSINLVSPLLRAPLIIFLALAHAGAIEIAYAYVVSSIAMLFVAWLFLKRDRIKWQKPTQFRYSITPLRSPYRSLWCLLLFLRIWTRYS